MRTTTFALPLLLCAGCATTTQGAPAATTAPPRTAPAPAAAEAWEAVPPKHQRAFLAALAKADPGLVDGDPQVKRALRRAEYTCREISRGSKGTELAVWISQRFTGGHGTVSIAEARRLVPALKKHICSQVR